jgi:hypothetical protein
MRVRHFDVATRIEFSSVWQNRLVAMYGMIAKRSVRNTKYAPLHLEYYDTAHNKNKNQGSQGSGYI